MTDTQKNLIQKEPDLKFYYKLAEEAAQAYDIEQALKISKDGLKFAQSQKKADWVEKFDTLNSRLSQPSSDQSVLTTSIVKEDFTIIKGVGPAVAKKLNDGNIKSIEVLANTPPRTLASSIAGIGVATAQKIVNGAKSHLTLKKLNDFSQPVEDDNYQQIQGDFNENLKGEDNSLKYEENLENKGPYSKSINNEPWFEEKFKYSRLGRSYNRRRKEINLQEYEEDEDVDEKIDDLNEINSEINNKVDLIKTNNLNITQVREIIDSKEIIERKPILIEQQDVDLGKVDTLSSIQDEKETHKESLSYQNLNKLTDVIFGEVKLGDFDIINKHPDLRVIHDGIDMVAIKSIQVHEFLDLLLLIPIKICRLKGSLIVSEDKIDYKPKEHKKNNFHIDRIPLSYMKALDKARKVIYDDIVNRGKFSKHLDDHLNTNIIVKKTITNKVLFLHSGQRQYKLLIEPLIVCQNSVGFTEKVLPFAYQKTNNFHVVSISQLTKFLEYIDQKYMLSEEYDEQKRAYKVYYIAKDRFWLNMRNIGFPFLLYSLVFIFIFIFQQYSALTLLINLGFGLIGLLSIIIGYVFLKFHKIKVNLHHDFAIPYYQKSYSFDETSLTLIKDKLTPKLMEQFTYEWIGKNSHHLII
ncbi:MAG: helix-hairpin-helix domain-containing protein [Candidatus Lokiarchaeota archaeon]|nr:helix-hairpin-helix domain-containing protein [Candidatus Lokiarchaeota archaeon]